MASKPSLKSTLHFAAHSHDLRLMVLRTTIAQLWSRSNLPNKFNKLKAAKEQPAFPLREFFKNIYFYKILILNPQKTNISYLATLGFSGLVVSVNIVEFLPSSLVADCGGVLGLFIGFNFVMMWDLLKGIVRGIATKRVWPTPSERSWNDGK